MTCPRKKTSRQKSLQNPFTRLPEDCLSEILSRTSPLAAARFAVVSKELRSTADSDNVWKRFVPTEIVQILSRSVNPMAYGSKKELFFRLCHSPVLLDDGNLSFSLTRETGNKCFMVGAKNLRIPRADDPQLCEWITHTGSRFSEVAQLKFASWHNIRGKIKTNALSQNARYGVYLVFKLENEYSRLKLLTPLVRHVYSEVAKNACVIRRQQLPRLIELQGGRRDDGWMEFKLGEFNNDWGDDGEVEACLTEIRCLTGKSRLIVEGIEFRPLKPRTRKRKVQSGRIV